jgi:transcriptional regulator with AAA-type ATPase domain
MALFSDADRPIVEALCRIVHTNPFSPEWVAEERAALGETASGAPDIYHRRAEWDPEQLHEYSARIRQRVVALSGKARRVLQTETASDAEMRLYQDLSLSCLYGDYVDVLTEAAEEACQAKKSPRLRDAWRDFDASFRTAFPAGRTFPASYSAERVFAVFFQMRRAFIQIYNYIIGGSRPAAKLRAAVWQSIFTHDLPRYYRSFSTRMSDFPTLIIGPSGTGKELVARAIGLSQYIPFNVKTGQFTARFESLFSGLNLSALAPTLLESELFGHVQGAFTGALADREGRLERCDPHGVVFLDEIGEVDPAIQVKLLRVLQTREFERLGECEPRRFQGRLLAATNRDLAVEMQAGRFRRDFFYRLCADQIETPSLRSQLEDCPADLENLVRFITIEMLGRSEEGAVDQEADQLTREVVDWIQKNLGDQYAWPGNFRELGHCVRSVLMRRDYRPLPVATASASDPVEELTRQILTGTLSFTELRRRIFTRVYEQLGTFEKCAEHLDVDWRTVKKAVENKPPE